MSGTSLKRRNVLFKTELCMRWVKTRQCEYGNKCTFAHGIDDLKCKILPEKYKIAMCRNIIDGKPCQYRHRCKFAHSKQEMRRNGERDTHIRHNEPYDLLVCIRQQPNTYNDEMDYVIEWKYPWTTYSYMMGQNEKLTYWKGLILWNLNKENIESHDLLDN
jgi:hypothetical protein